MSRVSVPLALEDFLPVLLSAIGFVFIVRIVWQVDWVSGRWAAIGAGLIVAGGLSRAVWKLIYAVGGPDLVALHGALYVLLAVGFPLLALAIRSARRKRLDQPPGLAIWAPVAVLMIGLLGVTLLAAPLGGRVVPLLWLGTATVASVAASLLLISWARAIGQPRVAWLLVANLVLTIVLNGLARPAEQTEALQWVQQGLNTLNQALFLVAARRLAQWTEIAPEARPMVARAD